MKKSTITPKMLKAITICALLVFGVTGTAAARKATPPSSATVTWSGNGTTLTEGSRTITTETCDAESTPYLLWILAGSKATSATINIDGDDLVSMGQPGINKKTGISTFKYTMFGTIDLDTAIVTASYNDAKNKATLTISHGCTGGTSTCASAPSLASDGSPTTSYVASSNSYDVSTGTWITIAGCTNSFSYKWQYTLFFGEGDPVPEDQWTDYTGLTSNSAHYDFLYDSPGDCVSYARALVTANNGFGTTTVPATPLIELCS